MASRRAKAPERVRMRKSVWLNADYTVHIDAVCTTGFPPCKKLYEYRLVTPPKKRKAKR